MALPMEAPIQATETTATRGVLEFRTFAHRSYGNTSDPAPIPPRRRRVIRRPREATRFDPWEGIDRASRDAGFQKDIGDVTKLFDVTLSDGLDEQDHE